MIIHYGQLFPGMNLFDFSLVATIWSKNDGLYCKDKTESLAVERQSFSKALDLRLDPKSLILKGKENYCSI